MGKIQNIKIAQLETNNGQIEGLPKNPRFIKDNRFKALVKSIEDAPEMLDYRTLLVFPHEKKYVIIAGNMRFRACKELGYKELPCYVLPEETPAEKLREYAIKDNIGFGADDWDILMNEWDTEELKDWGMEMPDDWQGNEEETEIEEDEIPEEVETRCKRGDVWILGEHRLMCGDSTKSEEVEKLMNGEKADMVFTDPPYGYEYQSNMRTKSKKFNVLKNDDKILDFFPILEKYANGFVFICTTWKVLDKWLPLFTQYYDLSNMVIWSKGGGGMGDLEHTFLTDYEIILVANNERPIKGKRLGSVWEIKKDNVNEYLHATQKPVKLSSIAIENTTIKNEIVLDVFGGSGSTLIACEQLQRKCYTMELDEHYCDVIISRWEKLTGKKAEKIN